MSREIKFRAWDTVNGTMRSVDSILFSRNGLPCSVDIGLSGNVSVGDDDSQVVLMQYTGLKDRNGAEIYEGDILRYGPSDEPLEVESFMEDNCSCCSKIWGWVLPDGTRIEDGVADTDVIGNVHENPELLNV